MILGYSAVSILSILSVSIPMIKAQGNEVRKNVADSAEAKMEKALVQIDKFFEKPISIVNDMCLYVSRADLDLKQTQDDFQNLISTDKSLSALYYVNEIPVKDGGTFYYSGGWMPAADYDQYTRSWFTDAQRSLNTVITEPYMDVPTQSLVTSVVRSVKRENGAFGGVVGIDISLNELNDVVRNLKLSESGKTFILDRNGVYLTNPDFKKIQNANFFDDYKFLSKYKSNFGNSLFLKTNAENDLYIAGCVVNEDSGWLLVTIGNTDEFFAGLHKNERLIFIMSLVALGLSLAVAILISTKIVNPIKRVNAAMKKIASGQADLTRRLDVQSSDEVGSLCHGFNAFMEKMQGLVGDVKKSETTLTNAKDDLLFSLDNASGSIKKILTNIEGAGDQIEQQAESVQQTSSAVEEIAENINSLERMIETQSQGVEQASSAVEEMLGNIAAVNTSVDKMADSFELLGANAQEGIAQQKMVSEQVANIAEQSATLQDANLAIASVASQTNLLAMNAAIEAAHAGEAGKGFSVVADEIRKLSETSAAESKKIGDELRKINESIEQVVGTTKESERSFAGVDEKIRLTDEIVQQIKSAMSEQKEGSKQIVDALKMVNDSTHEVHAAAREMAEGNRTILGEVKNLQDATHLIRGGMSDMSNNAREMGGTSDALIEISEKVGDAINQIGSQIGQFNV